jgi:hypothetical protein
MLSSPIATKALAVSQDFERIVTYCPDRPETGAADRGRMPRDHARPSALTTARSVSSGGIVARSVLSTSNRRYSNSWSTWCRIAATSSARTISSLQSGGGRIVSESTLTRRINAARMTVSDRSRNQELISTIPREGLRFIGAVHAQSDENQPAHAGLSAC